MMKLILIAIAATLLGALLGCGGGYEVELKRGADAALDDLAKCGTGAYWVPPAAGAPPTDRGTCYLYAVLPAASAPASAPG